jgi:type I restriction enzyme S subunit
MFGDPIRNSKRWEIATLGELGEWTSGGTPSRTKPEYFQGTIPWFSAGELNDSYILDSKEQITEEALKVSSAKLFSKGTMLIGMYDSAAFKMGLLLRPASSNQACAAFIPKKEKLEPLFALHLFKAMKPLFLSRRRGVRQKNLSQSIIKNFEIPIPPLPLQQKFARIIEKIESMRQSQNQSKQQIEDLFSAMMQKAFRGELDKSIYV